MNVIQPKNENCQDINVFPPPSAYMYITLVML